MFRCILYVFLALFIGACKKDVPFDNSAPLETVLSSEHPKIRKVMDREEEYGVQVVFTRITYAEDGSPVFEDYSYHAKDSVYFYPASTVKFPIAILALERLKEKKWMERNTRFYLEGDTIETTFAEEIKKIFAVSDNEAYNRLFEFLGTDYINYKMEEKGLAPFRLSHRLSTDNAANPATRALVVYKNDTTLVQLFSSYNKEPVPLEIEGVLKGNGFIRDSLLVEEPMDFSLKNYYPVQTLHNTMKRLIFPEAYPEDQRFDLRKEDRKFLLYAMKAAPAEAGYDRDQYPDSFDRFFMYGDTITSIPENIEIYNKVGYAYGTLTDCSYIRDKDNKVEFILTATVLVNENGIFNDGVYDYKETGLPFLAELGRQIYQYELAAGE